MDAVQISDVTKTFGAVTAVKDLRLNIPEGSIYGFTGPNGSGKTHHDAHDREHLLSRSRHD